MVAIIDTQHNACGQGPPRQDQIAGARERGAPQDEPPMVVKRARDPRDPAVLGGRHRLDPGGADRSCGLAQPPRQRKSESERGGRGTVRESEGGGEREIAGEEREEREREREREGKQERDQGSPPVRSTVVYTMRARVWHARNCRNQFSSIAEDRRRTCRRCLGVQPPAIFTEVFRLCSTARGQLTARIRCLFERDAGGVRGA